MYAHRRLSMCMCLCRQLLTIYRVEGKGGKSVLFITPGLENLPTYLPSVATISLKESIDERENVLNDNEFVMNRLPWS